jgi:hypothetical protein
LKTRIFDRSTLAKTDTALTRTKFFIADSLCTANLELTPLEQSAVQQSAFQQSALKYLSNVRCSNER